ncbi:YqaE/Pmp3 family membrane protein [Paraburkholderia sacchari]|uniref:YqaE/Pmp3 family membrane protein n=1 Tax=Paraburkholderia sacchari TaxID=159450 RepID=UPI0038B39BBD
MRFLTAVVFPWFTFLSIGRIKQARISMALQLTVVGWLPAAIWALRTSRRHVHAMTYLGAAIAAARGRQLVLPTEKDSR